MKAAPEIYKGIEYVRIFSLPAEQKLKIWETMDRNKIIKILKDKTLLSDCIQYSDYQEWYRLNSKTEVIKLNKQPVTSSKPMEFQPKFRW